MGRSPRITQGGFVYAVDCRALKGKVLFRKDEEFEAFKVIVKESVEKFEPRLLAYSLLPKRWIAIVVPRRDGDLSKWVGWLTSVHSMRRKVRANSKVHGGLYERRYRSFPIQDNERLLDAMWFVEQLGLGKTPPFSSEYRWSSLGDRAGNTIPDWLSSPPIALPLDWLERFKTPQPKEIVEQLENCAERGCPFGESSWIERTAIKLKLESTLRPRGRPRKSVG